MGKLKKFLRTSPFTAPSPRRHFIHRVFAGNQALCHFMHALFRNVTHPEFDVPFRWGWDRLKHLTHLAIGAEFGISRSTVSKTVAQFPDTLKVVIFWAIGVSSKRSMSQPWSEVANFGADVLEVMQSVRERQIDQRAVLVVKLSDFDKTRGPQWKAQRIVTRRKEDALCSYVVNNPSSRKYF